MIWVPLRAILRRRRERAARARLDADRRAGVRIAAGSTPTFPMVGHTFVYQELLAMRAIEGAHIRLFHSRHGDLDDLHAAFAELAESTEFVHPAIEAHRADLAWFRRTVPERVDSLFDALGEHSGLARDELEANFDLLIAFSYARRQAAWRTDYIHTWFFYNEALHGLVSSWLNDIPRGLTAYADHMLADWPLKVVPLHLQTAAIVVATSQRVREELLAIGGDAIAPKLIVKPNGVDGARFPFVARTASLGRGSEVLCVARIEEKKGLLHLVEAAAILRGRGHALRVHVVGAPDPESESSRAHAAALDRRIHELGLADQVVRHGRMRHEQLLPLLARVDAFVAPFVETDRGDKDGIPTAVLEAMASGIPVIASDAGSIPEVLDDGVHGILVPQRDPEAIADAILRLLAEPALGTRLAAAARARFERQFDVRVTEPPLHARIRTAIETRKSTRST